MPTALRTLIRSLIGLATLLSFATAAWAVDCSVSFANMSYGLVPSSAGATRDTQGEVAIRCSWGFFEVFAVQNVSACVHLGPGSQSYNSQPGGFRKLINGNAKLRHDLFSDAARSTVWGSRFDNLRGAQPVAVTISSAGVSIFGGSNTLRRPVYGRAFADAGLSGGSYSDRYSNTQAAITYQGNGNSLNCNNTSGTLQTGSFVVDAQIAAECSISASTLDFGSSSALTSALLGTSQITLNCTSGADWQVSLNAGNSNAASINNRRMTRTSGNQTIAYQLYRDASRSQIWGQTLNVNTAAGTGTGSDQSLTVYGRVPPQTTPAVGDYRDTIVATITF